MKFTVEVTQDQYNKFLDLAKKLGVEPMEDETSCDTNERIIPITLIRERSCENEIWADNIAMRVSEDIAKMLRSMSRAEAESRCKTILVSRIQSWLASADGWAAINQTCQDFNWGDWLTSSMPEEDYGIYVTKMPAKVDSGYDITLRVNQDELLAPGYESAKWTAMEDGNIQFSCDVTVDFRDGTIYGDIPEQYLSEYECSVTVGEKHDIIKCDPDEDNLRLAVPEQ